MKVKILYIISFVFIFSCSSNHEKQISKLLPNNFTLIKVNQKQFGIPTKVYLYTFDNEIQDIKKLKQYPIELKEEGWFLKKWHIVKNEEEKHYLFGMLDLAQYPITVNSKTNHFTDIVSSVKESLNNENGYVSYYYRKPKEFDFYKNGYIEFYCLQPEKQRIVYLSFGDI